MNFKRKNTDGYSIGGVLLDFSGGVANYAQMTVQSIDQNSWANFSGNIGKLLLAFVSIFFDLIFMSQHFLLYGARRVMIPSKTIKEKEPLIKSDDQPELENV
ncbi:Lysosomal cystine transporter [Trema orientale]|uniref:Lysosomal cystine transporter n=1 Tax=Trema orientale TaxID=63057 RepID=A0A2P5FBS6_TREOI|nr:Lysosomal cystine transporter [Trema orientale]